MLGSGLAKPFWAAMLIPTGVGAAQGGYGGDASVWMNLLAYCCDGLITHPNVANAAAFQKLPANALYVEGYGLNQFLAGSWALRPVRSNRIAVLLDAGMEPGMKVLHRNTVNAVAMVYGVDVVAVEETAEPLRLVLTREESGASAGVLENADSLLASAAPLFKEIEADALALCAVIEEPEDSTYAEGLGPDPIAGMEAVLSHTLVRHFEKPCANAPVFGWEAAQPRRDSLVDPRTAPEYITATFLPSVLQGLQRAPQWVSEGQARKPGDLTVEELDALVVPESCLGGPGVLGALANQVPVVAVRGNTTVQQVDAVGLLGEKSVSALQAKGKLFIVENYLEAAGLLQLLRLGLKAPHQL